MPAALLGLLGYWREALIAGLALGLLWYRGEALSCESNVAASAAKAAEAVQKAKDADAAQTRILAEQTLAATRALQEQANATQLALAKVKSDPNCARTPAAAAFDGSVRPGGQQAGSGPTRPAAR